MKDARLHLVPELVDQLTDKQLEAVDLVFIRGYGVSRTARTLGIAPSAVRARLDQVRNKARKVWGHGPGPQSAVRNTPQSAVRAPGTKDAGPQSEPTPTRIPKPAPAPTTGLFELDLWIRQREARDIPADPALDQPDQCDPRRLPGDAARLRGIPVVGARGIGGEIRGTRPDRRG